MHEPTLATLKQPQPTEGAKSAAGKAKKSKQKRLRTDGTGAFASADDYALDIEQDLAALPADVELSEQVADEQPKKARRKTPVQGRKRPNHLP